MSMASVLRSLVTKGEDIATKVKKIVQMMQIRFENMLEYLFSVKTEGNVNPFCFLLAVKIDEMESMADVRHTFKQYSFDYYKWLCC